MDDSTKQDSTKQMTVPVIAYKTFRGFGDALKITMPDRIDRSIMHSYSGGVQAQLVHALKALHLTGAGGVPTDLLRALTRSEGPERQAILKTVVKGGYPFLFDAQFSLKTATGRQLIDAFETTGITGDTVRKAIAFFLAASKDAGIDVSPYFKKLQLRTASKPTRRTKPDEVEEDDETEDLAKEKSKNGGGSSRTIKLKGGGTATLSFDVDVWSMTPQDQEFVFGMIKRLTEYEQQSNTDDLLG